MRFTAHAGGATGEVGEGVEGFKSLMRDIYVLSFDTPALAKLKTSPRRILEGSDHSGDLADL